MGSYGITPTTFQITSTDQIQSVLWVGKVGQIEVTKVIQFKNTDVYFSTTVTIQTLVHPLCGIYTVSDLSSPPSFYLSTLILFRSENFRSDQEQPYCGNFMCNISPMLLMEVTEGDVQIIVFQRGFQHSQMVS